MQSLENIGTRLDVTVATGPLNDADLRNAPTDVMKDLGYGENFDEDFELEMSEPALAMEIRRLYKKARPSALTRGERLRRVLEHEIWPSLPATLPGKPLTRHEEDVILGYGPDGV